MARYIDLDKAIESIRNGDGTSMQKLFAECCLLAVPATDVVPKSEVALEAIDDFQNTLRHIFVTMCNGNDYNNLNLLQIDSVIEALFDSKIAELKKKYTEEK